MTAKEKAQQLIDKFYEFTDGAYYDDAKQCALIAVEEIIGVLQQLYQDLAHNNYSATILKYEVKYYGSVKQEIEKL